MEDFFISGAIGGCVPSTNSTCALSIVKKHMACLMFVPCQCDSVRALSVSYEMQKAENHCHKPCMICDTGVWTWL